MRRNPRRRRAQEDAQQPRHRREQGHVAGLTDVARRHPGDGNGERPQRELASTHSHLVGPHDNAPGPAALLRSPGAVGLHAARLLVRAARGSPRGVLRARHARGDRDHAPSVVPRVPRRGAPRVRAGDRRDRRLEAAGRHPAQGSGVVPRHRQRREAGLQDRLRPVRARGAVPRHARADAEQHGERSVPARRDRVLRRVRGSRPRDAADAARARHPRRRRPRGAPRARGHRPRLPRAHLRRRPRQPVRRHVGGAGGRAGVRGLHGGRRSRVRARHRGAPGRPRRPARVRGRSRRRPGPCGRGARRSRRAAALHGPRGLDAPLGRLRRHAQQLPRVHRPRSGLPARPLGVRRRHAAHGAAAPHRVRAADGRARAALAADPGRRRPPRGVAHHAPRPRRNARFVHAARRRRAGRRRHRGRRGGLRARRRRAVGLGTGLGARHPRDPARPHRPPVRLNPPEENVSAEVHDIVLVGAGIMSATLGTLLRKLDPSLTVRVFERLDSAAAESSDAWNNAGTGHSAFCELNYTPEAPDGSVDVSKAVKIAEQYELSKQLWGRLVASGDLPAPGRFVRAVPHVAFVWGEAAVAFLHTRYRELSRSPLFAGMELTTDPERIRAWAPLVMEGRDPAVPVAATRMAIGNDVNFGTITRSLFRSLDAQPGVVCHFGHEVRDFRHKGDGIWRLKVHDLATGTDRIERARFVFLGAGGGTLPLLEATGIPEGDGFGGFPVSGQWLRCTNPEVIERHEAKVYGKAAVGAPPMSVPHLDTRWIDGRRNLLFGPYAGFSTKFLKRGSYLDLFQSIGVDNIVPMLAAGAQSFELTRYLVGQVLLEPEDRMALLREYLPAARDGDWELEIAGQRVQIIKKDAQRVGRLQFGTEVVTSADGSVAALLGASPGASTAVAIMLDVLARCFPDRMEAWRPALTALIPSYGRSLHDDADLCAQVRARSIAALGL
ncbi:MAG: malate dehydrogenase (quinone) [Alphaproteobacteria bacterium]|nr:malate dehydrogenase (quinone) [Alphaproteobacteria bacterium]